MTIMSRLKNIEKGFKSLFIHEYFFIGLSIVVAVFILSAFVPYLFVVGQYLVLVLILVMFVDIVLLFSPNITIQVQRKGAKILGLGDEEPIYLYVKNLSSSTLKMEVVDQLPVQFQERSFKEEVIIPANEQKVLSYNIIPKQRGVYVFRGADVLLNSKFMLFKRRMVFEEEQSYDCYPSVKQMKEMELKAFAQIQSEEGVKKVRRIGHSYEFEQIKNYTSGDDVRSLNWKATARRNELMVNQYTDEKAQQIYCVIDKSRVMHMPFNGMSLLDYAINSTLAISNVVLKKSDKAGLITFSDKVGVTLKADRSPKQIKKIHQLLFNEQERDVEANYQLLHRIEQNVIKSRSLIFLFANFESTLALDRVLPLLRKLNHQHLLVLVMFQNEELDTIAHQKANEVKDIYKSIIAKDLLLEKREMSAKLNKLGIQTVLSKPKDLSINTLNKYLELKAKGSI